jgi:hypothetical protein
MVVTFKRGPIRTALDANVRTAVPACNPTDVVGVSAPTLTDVAVVVPMFIAPAVARSMVAALRRGVTFTTVASAGPIDRGAAATWSRAVVNTPAVAAKGVVTVPMVLAAGVFVVTVRVVT